MPGLSLSLLGVIGAGGNRGALVSQESHRGEGGMSNSRSCGWPGMSQNVQLLARSLLLTSRHRQRLARACDLSPNPFPPLPLTKCGGRQAAPEPGRTGQRSTITNKLALIYGPSRVSKRNLCSNAEIPTPSTTDLCSKTAFSTSNLRSCALAWDQPKSPLVGRSLL